MNQAYNAVLIFVIATAALFVILRLVTILSCLSDFLEELDRINMELGRCSACRRPQWLRRRRRLLCSLLIPFYKY